MPVTFDSKLETRLLRLDAASRSLLLEMDSGAPDAELQALHDLCVRVRQELDRIFASDNRR